MFLLSQHSYLRGSRGHPSKQTKSVLPLGLHSNVLFHQHCKRLHPSLLEKPLGTTYSGAVLVPLDGMNFDAGSTQAVVYEYRLG